MDVDFSNILFCRDCVFCCKMVANDNDGLRKHYETVHPKVKIRACSVCLHPVPCDYQFSLKHCEDKHPMTVVTAAIRAHYIEQVLREWSNDQQAQPIEWLRNEPVCFWELRAAFGVEDPCWMLYGGDRPVEVVNAQRNFVFVENPEFTYEQLLFNVMLASNEPVSKGTIHDLYRMTEEWSKENEKSY